MALAFSDTQLPPGGLPPGMAPALPQETGPVTVYGLVPLGEMDIPDLSPFVSKLLAYFKMAGISVQYVGASVHTFTNPEAPKGKVPYIEWKGDIYSDSSHIIEIFENMRGSSALDSHLSDYDKAVSVAMKRMMEESLYWTAIIVPRWCDERSYESTFRTHEPWFGVEVFDFVNGVLGWNQQRVMIGYAEAQGIGRHKLDEVQEMAMEELKALNSFLGSKKFFMGDKWSTLDATAYGFLVNIIRDTELFPHDPIRQYLKSELGNLTAYLDRMQNALNEAAEQIRDVEQNEAARLEAEMARVEGDAIDDGEIVQEKLEKQPLLTAEEKERQEAELVIQREKEREQKEKTELEEEATSKKREKEEEEKAAKKKEKPKSSDWGYEWD